MQKKVGDAQVLKNKQTQREPSLLQFFINVSFLLLDPVMLDLAAKRTSVPHASE